MRNRDITFFMFGLFLGYLLAHASDTSPHPSDVLHAAGSVLGPLASAL